MTNSTDARGRVVRRQRARAPRISPVSSTGTARCTRISSTTLADDAAEPEDHGIGAGAVDDGRLDPDPALAAVEHEVDVVAEIGAHVGRGRGADPPEAVRRRRGDAPAERAEQVERERLVGHAQTDGREPAGDRVDHAAVRGARRR